MLIRMICLSLCLSSSAFATEVMYCGIMSNEGVSLKVDLENNVICLGAGQQRKDFCQNEWATAYPIVSSTTGTMALNGREHGFREFVGMDEAKQVQIVRVYNEAPNPSGADVTIHRADIFGNLMTLAPTTNPAKEIHDGESFCLAGDSNSIE